MRELANISFEPEIVTSAANKQTVIRYTPLGELDSSTIKPASAHLHADTRLSLTPKQYQVFVLPLFRGTVGISVHEWLNGPTYIFFPRK